MKHFVIAVGWSHRKWGPQRQTLRGAGSSLPLAVKRALQSWLKQLDRKDRFDAMKGITLSVVPVPTVTEESNAVDKRAEA